MFPTLGLAIKRALSLIKRMVRVPARANNHLAVKSVFNNLIIAKIVKYASV